MLNLPKLLQLKFLVIVTKEHINFADCNPGKAEKSTKTPDQSQHGVTDNSGDMPQSMKTISQNQSSAAADRIESFDAVQTYGGSEAVTDDMEHDQDLDDGFDPSNEDDCMHETPEDTRDLQNGLDNVGIRFEIRPHDQEILVDEFDEEEMSGDDGDEDEDEEYEEHNDLEDKIHHLPHPDTDQEDHELDEEVMDEEDEDEEDGVILRLEEGINGINVIDHIKVLRIDHIFANETLHVIC